MDNVRLDKWLWAARFFKTRALAVKACDMGRVKLREQPAKPARDIRVGDALSITNDSATFGVEVLALSDVRGPAAVAQTLFRETEDSIAGRKQEDERGRATPGSTSTPPAGRTSATAATSTDCAAADCSYCLAVMDRASSWAAAITSSTLTSSMM